MQSAAMSEEVTCYCGAVKVTLTGEPTMQCLCHCSDCRRWNGSVAFAAKMFPSANVKVEGELIGIPFVEGCKAQRRSCAKCGGCVLNDLTHSMKSINICAGLSAKPFAPTMHLFYKEKMMAFKDGLPKFKDMPAPFGGSGETLEE